MTCASCLVCVYFTSPLVPRLPVVCVLPLPAALPYAYIPTPVPARHRAAAPKTISRRLSPPARPITSPARLPRGANACPAAARRPRARGETPPSTADAAPAPRPPPPRSPASTRRPRPPTDRPPAHHNTPHHTTPHRTHTPPKDERLPSGERKRGVGWGGSKH